MNDGVYFWESFKDQRVFLGFRITGSGTDIKKIPVGVDGQYGAAAGDIKRLGTYDQAIKVGNYAAVSLTQPLIIDGKHLVCLDFDWKRSAAGQPNDQMIESMGALLGAGHEYENSASGFGAHIWVLMDEAAIPKKFNFADGCGFEVFSGVVGQRANVIFTGHQAQGRLQYLERWDFYQGQLVKSQAAFSRPKSYQNTNGGVEKILSYVPASGMDYETWLKVGMALKDEMGDAGFSTWDAWSSQGDNYDETVMRSKWQSFKGSGISFGTVVKMAKDNGMPRFMEINRSIEKLLSKSNVIDADGVITIKPNFNSYEQACAVIENADNSDILVNEVVSKIKGMNGIDPILIDSLAHKFKEKAKKLGMYFPVQEIRNMITPKEVILLKENAKHIQFSQTQLAKDWVFLSQSDEFYKPSTGERISPKAVNIKFAADMPIDFNGNRKEAAKMFAELGGRSVYADMFVPELFNPADPFFTINGVDCVNSYSKSGTPEFMQDWENGSKWGAVKAHIFKMFESPDDAQTLINWLAHNVQHPGKKILWACIVVGLPGDGKSSIARVMGSAMGHKNVKNIGLDEVKSSFTSWAEGSCLGVIEELRVTGHNRHEVMDRLKPFITNKSVAIIKKGKDGIDKPNTQNYLCFSNHSDALALDDSDRRWAVFSTKYTSREHVLSENNADYWENLYQSIDTGGSEIRSWLLSVDLKSFNKNAPPVVSQAKKRMIVESKNDIFSNLDELLIGTSFGYSENVIIPKYLISDLKKYWGQSVSSKFLAKSLKEIGFIPLSELSGDQGVWWWDQTAHKPYVREKWAIDKLNSPNCIGRNMDRAQIISEILRLELKSVELGAVTYSEKRLLA